MRARISAALALLLVSSSAGAQDEPGDAVAEALFRDGRALMTERRYPEACAKLAESERLDPRIGTLLNLAACRVLEGRTATAWAEYEQARAQAARAGRTEREAFAVEQLRALEPRLARVVVAAAHPPAGLVLALDGQQLEAGALGTALPVDPGPHQLSASAPDHARWSASFDAHEATTQTVRVPDLASIEAPSPSPAVVPRSPERPPAPAPASGTSGTVWILGGVAVAATGVGSYFGVETLVRNGDASSACPHLTCTPTGLQADADARRDATIATVAFAVAGAAAVGAVVLFVVGRGSRATHVAFTPSGVEWRGAW